jgi:hypothetical protein
MDGILAVLRVPVAGDLRENGGVFTPRQVSNNRSQDRGHRAWMEYRSQGRRFLSEMPN